MEDLKKLSVKEIAKRMINYINRIEELENLLCEYLNKMDMEKAEKIKEMYKELKNDINEEYKYLDKTSNDIMNDISVVHNCYRYAIMEASAKGFSVKTNGIVDQKMLNSVLDASFYLKYYMNKEQLEDYMVK